MKIDKEIETKISKKLSYWLRHNPYAIGLYMSPEGWVDIKELMSNSEGDIFFDYNDLLEVVKNNKKNRFSLDRDMRQIRANQGHSKALADKIGLKVDSQVPVIPPSILYHGTKSTHLDSIKEKGISKMKRQHVHLSIDEQTAITVASRRKGEYTILKIEARELHHTGQEILISENNVYLTDDIPIEFIKFE